MINPYNCTGNCDDCPLREASPEASPEASCEGRSILIKLPAAMWESLEVACDIGGTSPGRIIQQIISAVLNGIVADAIETAINFHHLKNKMH